MNRRNVEGEHVVVLLNPVLKLDEEGVILIRPGDDEVGDVPRIAVANVFDPEPHTRSEAVGIITRP